MPMPAQQKTPLIKWIWNAYVKTALIPLVLVELVFLSIYFLSGSWSQNVISRFVEDSARNQVQEIAVREARSVRHQLQGISNAAELYRLETQSVLLSEALSDSEDDSRLGMTPQGVLYSARDRMNGGAAVFYSGISPVGPSERQKVLRLLSMQPYMKNLKQSEPLVAAVYFNTFDSLNVIYPYFDVLEQYAPLMDIPSFNFYYEADAAHNPGRTVQWTDAYLDPAGQGWMASAIAPVYRGDFLEGVVGLDVTIETIVQEVLGLDIPWDGYGMLVSQDGTILALPPVGEHDWGLSEMTDHHYDEAIRSDTFKPDQFNIFKRTEFKKQAQAMRAQDSGVTGMENESGRHLVAWSVIPETGWRLLVLVPEESLYAVPRSVQHDLTVIGRMMIGGLVGFYALFFAFLFGRARRMSVDIAKPLEAISGVADKIGRGEFFHEPVQTVVMELDETGKRIVDMGLKLAAATEAMETARRAAERSNEAKTQFLSNMSHELRTPLNAILGFAQILEMDPDAPLTEEQQESVEEIMKAGQMLLELINELLDLSRIESGKLVLSLEPVQVGAIAEEALTMIRPIADAYGISLEAVPGECASRFVLADRVRIKQILINLMSNAIKYNRPGGSVRLWCKSQNDWIRATVQDTGLGISDADAEVLFAPFQRGNRHSPEIEGTGIGLSVSKQLVELMGGRIGFTTAVDVGSAFWVELPVAEPLAEETEIDDVQELKQIVTGREVKLLYIEDNPSNMLLMERIVRWIPETQLIGAKTGAEGIQAAQATLPDLILLDFKLPDMEGPQVAKALKASVETRHIPIIVVSAQIMAANFKTGPGELYAGYLMKPLTLRKFVEVVKIWIEHGNKNHGAH